MQTVSDISSFDRASFCGSHLEADCLKYSWPAGTASKNFPYLAVAGWKTHCFQHEVVDMESIATLIWRT
jgi:hypothetical protein